LFENIDIFIFLKFYIFFELLENMCHTTRAVGQTLKEKENYFWYFLKIIWKKVSHDASGRIDTIKMKENFFIYFLIFYNF